MEQTVSIICVAIIFFFFFLQEPKPNYGSKFPGLASSPLFSGGLLREERKSRRQGNRPLCPLESGEQPSGLEALGRFALDTNYTEGEHSIKRTGRKLKCHC